MNAAMLILVGLLTLFAILLLLFEKGKADERLIAIIATLGALAAVARILFAAIPNVQPTTFLVMISGYVFGVRSGFLVGVTAALFSNFYLGHGPWTLWQMLGWGLAGAFAGALRKLMEARHADHVLLATRGKRWLFAICCMVWGYLFGWIMNLWVFLAQGSYATWGSFLAVYGRAIAFDTAHAVGNFLFALPLAHGFAKSLSRYHRKLMITRLSVKEEKR
jgi:energy-coupling factor transport system substrate-specific component